MSTANAPGPRNGSDGSPLRAKFGRFELDLSSGELRRNGAKVKLPEQPFQILASLLERPGEVVSREELRRRLWPDTFVDFEHSLNAAVKRLREALDDPAENPRFVETVHRRGYRFIAPVDAEMPALPKFPAADSNKGQRKLALMLAGSLVMVFALADFFYWRLGSRINPKPSAPSFERLTFRRGKVMTARFAPDNQTVVYSATWDNGPLENFAVQSGAPESRSLGLSDDQMLSVSPAGEMAVLLKPHMDSKLILTGTLARVPISGGAPRELLEGVIVADWGPNGTLAVERRPANGRNQIEYPPGKVLYQTAGWIETLRVSPRGDYVAFLDQPVFLDDRGSIAIVDRAGKKTVLSQGWESERGLAWSPKGDEVWFAGAKSGVSRNLYAVNLAGRVRQVLEMPGGVTLLDVARDGRVLLTRDSDRSGILGLPAGKTKEVDLSWLDFSVAADISADGKFLLFTEQGEAAGPSYKVGLRNMDGSPPVILGDGMAQALSPDGRWALAIIPAPADQLELLPIGAGNPRGLEKGPIEHYSVVAGSWLPDSSQVIFAANEPGHAKRCYIQNIAGGKPRPVTPEGMDYCVGSPDGQKVLAGAFGQDAVIYSLNGGESRSLFKLGEGELPMRWSSDGASIYVCFGSRTAASVSRINVVTGRKEGWKVLTPEDRSGVAYMFPPVFTPDGQSYVYTYIRMASDLYLVKGLN